MVVCFPDQLKHRPPDQSELVLVLQFHLLQWVLSRFYTLAACLGLRKNEVLAVKKVKSSLSSSRLQYPLLMLLLLVMEGVITVLTVMERSRDSLRHQRSTRAARWQLEEVLVDFFLAKKAGLMWKSATIRVYTCLTVLYSSRKSQRSTADASRELESHLWGRDRWTWFRLGALRATGEGTRKSESKHRRVTSSCVSALTPVSQTHTIQ